MRIAVIMEPKKGGIFPPGNEQRGCVANKAAAPGHVAAVAMITFNRPNYLQKAVDSLLSVHQKHPDFKCALLTENPPSIHSSCGIRVVC